jgi:hypothetical protein
MVVAVPDAWTRPRPFGLFVFGVILLVPAVFATITGKLYGKGGMVDRAKSPIGFWLTLILQYSVAVFLILRWAYWLPH